MRDCDRRDWVFSGAVEGRDIDGKGDLHDRRGRIFPLERKNTISI